MVHRYAATAFDLVDSLHSLSEPAAVMESFGEAVKQFGFHSFLITGLPLPGRNLEPYVLLNGWPDGWFKRYVARNYVQHDPIALNCYATINPFLWSTVTKSVELKGVAKKVMDDATEFDMQEGFVVPVFDSRGFQAAVTMAGGKLDFPMEAGPAVHLMAIYAHAKIRQLVYGSQDDGTDQPGPPNFKPLTEREREILKWTAMGKTAWETSQILHISRRTVEDHLLNVRSKLDTATSTQAVVEALRLRLIHL
jgi:LuxR family transcriptional regulator, quorum-sensing system regulator BjaR1